MYDNIGKKIKVLAKVLAWIGIILSVISGIGIATAGNIMFVFIGTMIAILGSVLSWASSFCLYGFGEMIDNISDMNERLDYFIRKKT